MSKNNEKNGKKRGLSLGVKMVMLTLVPVISAIVALMLFSLSILSEGMEAEVIDGLKSLAYSARAAYNVVDDGDYYIENECLYKGDTNITRNTDLVDSFTENSDVEVTIFYGDTRYSTSIVNSEGERIIHTAAAEEVVAAVLKNGDTYQDTDLVINETPFFAYYVPLEDSSGEVVGMVFAGRPQTSVNEFIVEELIKLVIIGVVLLIVAIVISAFFAMRMVKPINAVANYMAVMGTGQLNIAIDDKILKRRDEIGQMVRAVQSLSGQLKEILVKIQADADALLNAGDQLSDMSEQTSSTANEIGKAVEDISKGAVSQADEVESATVEVENIGEMIQQIVEDAHNMDEVSDRMKQLGDKVGATIDELTETEEKTNLAVHDIAESVHMTDKFVEKIQEAVAVITSIASETSLLSLNASIEAARAGEAGRGFAVVASEIQNLADQSGKSALEIEQVIKELSDASAETVTKTDEVGIILEEQKTKLKETRQEFAQLETGIDNTKEASNTILERTQVCNNSREKVMDVIQNLSAISEENAASSQETTASMEELNATINLVAEEAGQLHTLATDLESALTFFKV